MNYYDWKMFFFVILITGVCLIGVAWGYYYHFPGVGLAFTNLMSGVIGGCTCVLSVICFLKMKEYENMDEGGPLV